VLGLSTLSFYGEPQTKLSNIAIGFAFGIIAGTIYVTYQAAAHPNEFYNSQTELRSKQFGACSAESTRITATLWNCRSLGYGWSF